MHWNGSKLGTWVKQVFLGCSIFFNKNINANFVFSGSAVDHPGLRVDSPQSFRWDKHSTERGEPYGQVKKVRTCGQPCSTTAKAYVTKSFA